MIKTFLLTAATICLATLSFSAAAATDTKTLPTLKVGFEIFTNVVVTDISEGTVSIRHSGGLASFGAEKLDADLQRQLGIQPMTQRKPDRPTPKGATDSSHHFFWKDMIDDSRSGKWSTGETVCIFAMPVMGLLLVVIGNFWIVVVAFRTSLGWGMACVFGSFICGLIPLAFVLSHWDEAKKAFGCKALGLATVFLAGIVVPNFVQAKRVHNARAAEHAPHHAPATR